MTRPVHRYPGNPAGRLLLVLVLLCPQVWTSNLSGQDGSSDTYRTAYGRGYVDGHRSGESDREARHYYDMANKRDYQRLDPGFDPDRDDPEVYRNAYRRGFEAGYDDGYYPDRPGSRRRAPVPEPDGREARSPAAADSESKLRIPAGTEIRVRMKEPLTTRTHKVGDTFSARVIQSIDAGRARAIPKGVEVRGSISQLVRAGRIRGRARMNLHFKELRFRDGRVVPMDAQMASLVEPRKRSVPDEEGTLEEPGEKGREAGKVGASSAIGALIGLIGGGKEGVAVGAAAGAAVGAAGILVTRGRDIVIPVGTEIVIRLSKDLDLPASRRSVPDRREENFHTTGDAL
ncbi:MAG: hypothetical protein OXH11_20715 [Candidatus Aminicenantes bacterium]|nr:hypothetical protein [Candidatus Aminicenantes bacterium]